MSKIAVNKLYKAIKIAKEQLEDVVRGEGEIEKERFKQARVVFIDLNTTLDKCEMEIEISPEVQEQVDKILNA